MAHSWLASPPMGKKGQNFWAMAILKPLPGHLAMRWLFECGRPDACCAVVFHIKLHAQLGACLAGATFANNGQWRTDGFLRSSIRGWKPNCGSQIFFEAGHIDHPIERFNTLLAGFKIKVATLVAFNVHFEDGRASGPFRPAP